MSWQAVLNTIDAVEGWIAGQSYWVQVAILLAVLLPLCWLLGGLIDRVVGRALRWHTRREAKSQGRPTQAADLAQSADLGQSAHSMQAGNSGQPADPAQDADLAQAGNLTQAADLTQDADLTQAADLAPLVPGRRQP